MRQSPASQYDPALPNRPFGTWFDQIVGSQAGVTWHLTECIERTGMPSDPERDLPACVEATAILPNERKVVVQLLVGAFKQGLASKTTFHFAVIEDDYQLHSVQRLGDLPQMLRMPLPGIRLRPVALPALRRTAAPPRLYLTILPPLIEPAAMRPRSPESEVPPPEPKRAPDLRISKGVSTGDAITRVTPIYPSIAKQINASGEVQVEIEIDESGRVVGAKAVNGHPTLRGAAEDAARKWVFKPTLLGGAPVRSKGVLTFIFTRPQ